MKASLKELRDAYREYEGQMFGNNFIFHREWVKLQAAVGMIGETFEKHCASIDALRSHFFNSPFVPREKCFQAPSRHPHAGYGLKKIEGLVGRQLKESVLKENYESKHHWYLNQVHNDTQGENNDSWTL